VELQRLAMIGWTPLIQQWQHVIGDGKILAPALITAENLSVDRSHEKLLGALARCLACGDIPIINENDALCDDEIKFGDNDTLAGHLARACAVAKLALKTQLILLTNRDGLYKNPEDTTTLLSEIHDIAQAEIYAGGTTDIHSRGGMTTKVEAARIAKTAGVETFIANGAVDHAVTKTLRRDIGTYFSA
jgi:glutamate 5-kinase